MSADDDRRSGGTRAEVASAVAVSEAPGAWGRDVAISDGSEDVAQILVGERSRHRSCPGVRALGEADSAAAVVLVSGHVGQSLRSGGLFPHRALR